MKLNSIAQKVLILLLRKGDEFIVPLSNKGNLQSGMPLAVIPTLKLWRDESFLRKVKSILTFRWSPSSDKLEVLARQTLMDEIFGETEDFAEPLFDLMLWHADQGWLLNNLTEADIEKAEAIESMTALYRRRHWGITSKYLSLHLGLRAPELCLLLGAAVVKIPVRSIRYFIDVNVKYTFDSIRRSNHAFQDDIIAFLYEVLFLQQKIATILHSLVCIINSIDKNNQDVILVRDEMDGIVTAELIITYLKASMEKTIALIGYTFSIKGLESKKTHKSKLKALDTGIDSKTKQLPYFEVIRDFISSERLEGLNSYRNGIMHKRGISVLQPHSYTKNKDSDSNLLKILHELKEQHSKNSIIILCSIALLTDELVKLDRPNVKIRDIPTSKFLETYDFLLKKNEKSTSKS